MSTSTPSTRTRSRRVLTLATAVTATIVLSGCLGPNDPDPTGTAPIGHLDFAVADGASVRLAGWTLDPDTAASVEVMVMVNDTIRGYPANVVRQDVAAAHPHHGARHGFDIRTPPLPPGRHEVCIWVPNVGRGTQDRLLGCPEVVTSNDDVTGAFESLVQLGHGYTIRATGWAYDPDAGASSAVSVTVDGRTPPSRVHAGQPRPDINWHTRKAGNYGFVADFAVTRGSHQVCITALNKGRGKHRNLGCKSIWVNDVPTIGPGDGLSSAQLVAPPPNHPLRNIDRDAGISTRLRDGSVVWFFGDSSEGIPNFRYFVNNTAAWASAGSPTVTKDGIAPGGIAHTFAMPNAPFAVPCPAGWKPAMWPMSATNVPVGGSARDRVLVFFGNTCLNGPQATARGVSVVEWTYDPASPPDNRRMQGTVLNQNLFPAGVLYGNASTIVQDPPGETGTFVYAYRCGGPDESRTGIVWPSDPSYDGCTVGRSPVGQVHIRNTWEFWTGDDDWSDDIDDAETMDMPGLPNGDRQSPVSNFTITNDLHFGHVMVYSPWPGFSHEVFVRRAPGPTGPWSSPDVIDLPGCDEWADGSERWCYAATAQPWRSKPGEIGIGYYDTYAAMNPTRGSYIAASAPLS